MNEQGIQEILDKLGSRVSQLSEENRLCKLHDDAGKELFTILDQYIAPEDWVNIYESTENMQKIQPQIKIIQKKYKNDPQRLNKETMKLYKYLKILPLPIQKNPACPN